MKIRSIPTRPRYADQQSSFFLLPQLHHQTAGLRHLVVLIGARLGHALQWRKQPRSVLTRLAVELRAVVVAAIAQHNGRSRQTVHRYMHAYDENVAVFGPWNRTVDCRNHSGDDLSRCCVHACTFRLACDWRKCRLFMHLAQGSFALMRNLLYRSPEEARRRGCFA